MAGSHKIDMVHTDKPGIIFLKCSCGWVSTETYHSDHRRWERWGREHGKIYNSWYWGRSVDRAPEVVRFSIPEEAWTP